MPQEKRVPNQIDYRRRAKGLPPRPGVVIPATRQVSRAAKIDHDNMVGITGAAVGKDGKKLTLAQQLALARGEKLPEAPTKSFDAIPVVTPAAQAAQWQGVDNEIPAEFRKTKPVPPNPTTQADDVEDEEADKPFVDMTKEEEQPTTEVDRGSEELDAI